MGFHALLKTAQGAAPSSMNYLRAFAQLGHSILLGILLMMLTIWIGQRTAKLQNRTKDKDRSSESLQGAINVLFFCFGMTGIMILVDDNIARAFAIGATIALVRFRVKMGNSMLSTAFLFSVVIGMACGVGNIPIAWSIALLYGLVTICLSAVLSWRSSVSERPLAPDFIPGQLIRDAQGNWKCRYPRYTATVDGLSGQLVSLLVKGKEVLVGRAASAARGGGASSGAVAEFDSPYTGRPGLSVVSKDYSLWWHFFSDSVAIECSAASAGDSEITLFLTKNVSPLSRPYAARSRHLSALAQRANAVVGETGISAVARGDVPLVFHAPALEVAGSSNGKWAHGITLSGPVGSRWAAEVQIGPSSSTIPPPEAP